MSGNVLTFLCNHYRTGKFGGLYSFNFMPLHRVQSRIRVEIKSFIRVNFLTVYNDISFYLFNYMYTRT